MAQFYACAQCVLLILCTGSKFGPVSIFTQLHVLTQVARSYVVFKDSKCHLAFQFQQSVWRHNSNVCNTLALSLSHIFFFQFAWYLSNSTFITIYCLRFKIITHTLRTCVELSHLVNFARRACDQCSVFSTICPDYGLLLELHTLTQVANFLCALDTIYMYCKSGNFEKNFSPVAQAAKIKHEKIFLWP